ncbi:rod shape-determining protein RodA [Clostridium sp.]|jgi:rod shape determining protein RodA|uniref:rod shape-determining protein RodA n=3 Tax=Clostridium TaxID=1485 RepID=UPI0025BC2115|nr:rod shape-determining protein RodA [Clostridium sp.]MCI9070359.1 rod shape-determining protein RodA [Clostridium sp.]MCI9303304.1 rod shape-determining protein RodA [Clostridium sp.]
MVPLSKFKLNLKNLKKVDKLMFISIILITMFGIVNIYLAKKASVGGMIFPIKQSIFFIAAILFLYFILSIDYSIIKAFTPIFYWTSIALLVLVLIIGANINGAQGWIRLGPLSFQPAELAKIATVMMMGKKLEDLDGEINNLKNFFVLAFYAIIPAGLIVIQPDMGMTMVLFFMVLGVFFIGGLDKRIIIGGLGALIVGIVLVWNSGLIHDYQKRRITSFRNPETDTSGSGYHLRQSLIAIGSGGFLGTLDSLANDGTGGYASQYVPEIQTDFIFSQVCQQWGTFGAICLLSLYGVLISRMINIARTAKDMFGSILTTGMISYFLFAIWQNIGMTIGLMPITGITLPLVSYGGSSLATTIISLGMVLNIGMRRKKINF